MDELVSLMGFRRTIEELAINGNECMVSSKNSSPGTWDLGLATPVSFMSVDITPLLAKASKTTRISRALAGEEIVPSTAALPRRKAIFSGLDG